MADVNDSVREARDLGNASVDALPEYAIHPLFAERGACNHLDIRHVTFRRRVENGSIEHALEDYDANAFRSWREIFEAWGGGDYQVIAKDSRRQIVAYYPAKHEWISFETPSKPFTRSDGWFSSEPWPTDPEVSRTHPAARPGTGHPVEWRDEDADTVERHVVSPWLRCLWCGWYQSTFYGKGCACGACNWENLEPELPEVPPSRPGSEPWATQTPLACASTSTRGPQSPRCWRESAAA
jgi:hypothetical protein